jgi:hypothetical protein
LTASDKLEKRDSLAMPRLVGGSGILETSTLPLNNDEARQPRDSARRILDALMELLTRSWAAKDAAH